MGRMQLEGMIEMAGTSDEILTWHLTSPSQSYPPHPVEMVAVARAAIDAANAGENDKLIDLFDGVTWRDGRDSVEAWRLVDSLNLDAFIEQDEFYED